MNDTGGGVTAIHDVPGDITRIGFHWMLFFPFCHSKGASICSSRGVSRRSRIILSRIFEFSNFFFTRNVADVTDFLCPEFANLRIVSSHGMSRNNLFYHELSNYRMSFTRIVAECHGFFLITRLVLGPTDQREVIIELSNIFHTECRGDHGFFLSRFFSLSRIFELSNCFFTRNVAECRGFFYPETCPWTH